MYGLSLLPSPLVILRLFFSVNTGLIESVFWYQSLPPLGVIKKHSIFPLELRNLKESPLVKPTASLDASQYAVFVDDISNFDI